MLIVVVLGWTFAAFGSADPQKEIDNNNEETSSIAFQKAQSIDASKPHFVSDNDDDPERPKYKKLRRVALILLVAGLLSILSLFYIPLLIVPVLLVLASIIMFVISMEMKRRYKKKNDPTYTRSKGAWNIVGQIIGWIFAGYVAGAGIFAWLYFGLDL